MTDVEQLPDLSAYTAGEYKFDWFLGYLHNTEWRNVE